MIPRWAHITGVLGIAAAHTWLFTELFGYTLYASLARQKIPMIIEIAIRTLGIPLQWLFSPLRSVCESFGCEWRLVEYLYIGLAVLNGLLWGMALMWALRVWTRRRSHAP